MTAEGKILNAFERLIRLLSRFFIACNPCDAQNSCTEAFCRSDRSEVHFSDLGLVSSNCLLSGDENFLGASLFLLTSEANA